MIGTVEVAAYFKKTEPTIRAWANEFVAYLSPLANPGKGKGRTFTPDDLMVFSLVAAMKDQNHTFEDIHTVLRSGQRGEPLTLSENDLKILRATEGEKRAVFEIQALQQHVIDLRDRLNQAEAELAKAREISVENIRLEVRLENAQDQIRGEQAVITNLQNELKETQEEVRRLSREIGETHGQAYVEGYKAGLNDAKPSASDGSQ